MYGANVAINIKTPTPTLLSPMYGANYYTQQIY